MDLLPFNQNTIPWIIWRDHIVPFLEARDLVVLSRVSVKFRRYIFNSAISVDLLSEIIYIRSHIFSNGGAFSNMFVISDQADADYDNFQATVAAYFNSYTRPSIHIPPLASNPPKACEADLFRVGAGHELLVPYLQEDLNKSINAKTKFFRVFKSFCEYRDQISVLFHSEHHLTDLLDRHMREYFETKDSYGKYWPRHLVKFLKTFRKDRSSQTNSLIISESAKHFVREYCHLLQYASERASIARWLFLYIFRDLTKTAPDGKLMMCLEGILYSLSKLQTFLLDNDMFTLIESKSFIRATTCVVDAYTSSCEFQNKFRSYKDYSDLIEPDRGESASTKARARPQSENSLVCPKQLYFQNKVICSVQPQINKMEIPKKHVTLNIFPSYLFCQIPSNIQFSHDIGWTEISQNMGLPERVQNTFVMIKNLFERNNQRKKLHLSIFGGCVQLHTVSLPVRRITCNTLVALVLLMMFNSPGVERTYKEIEAFFEKFHPRTSSEDSQKFSHIHSSPLSLKNMCIKAIVKSYEPSQFRRLRTLPVNILRDLRRANTICDTRLKKILYTLCQRPYILMANSPSNRPNTYMDMYTTPYLQSSSLPSALVSLSPGPNSGLQPPAASAKFFGPSITEFTPNMVFKYNHKFGASSYKVTTCHNNPPANPPLERALEFLFLPHGEEVLQSWEKCSLLSSTARRIKKMRDVSLKTLVRITCGNLPVDKAAKTQYELAAVIEELKEYEYVGVKDDIIYYIGRKG
eukprot:TRINITY_DN9879_c0_g1_i1.p1 TRINITY_DN9879_c0_g1~~TRINITY_DN9879_c0_g1_i1.p1  ORF type:complete len:749 (+),score=199.86 TRINITY_DN9879_c0_g1_i1:62-2308(+)